jgi:hypothetical protein
MLQPNICFLVVIIFYSVIVYFHNGMNKVKIRLACLWMDTKEQCISLVVSAHSFLLLVSDS